MHAIEIRRKALAWAAELATACSSPCLVDGAKLISKAYADCINEEAQDVLSEAFNAICRISKHPSFIPPADFSSLLTEAWSMVDWVNSSPESGGEVGSSSTPKIPDPGPNPLCPACGALAHPRIDATANDQEMTALTKRLLSLETAVLALQSSRCMPMGYARRDPVPAVGWMQSFSVTQQSPERAPERGSDPVVCSTGSMPIHG